MSDPFDWTIEPDLQELYDAHAALEQDWEAAMARLVALAGRGSIASMNYLGWEYASRADDNPENLAQAEMWFRQAVELGSLAAIHQLACLLEKAGRLADQVELLTSGAQRGYAPAIYKLGKLYYYGVGVEKDLARARILFEQAAAAGHVFAVRKLASMSFRRPRHLLDRPYALYLFAKVFVRLGVVLCKEGVDSPKLKM